MEVIFVVSLFSVDLLDSTGRKDRPGSILAHESVLLLCEILLVVRCALILGFRKDQLSLIGGGSFAAVFRLEDLFFVGSRFK